MENQTSPEFQHIQWNSFQSHVYLGIFLVIFAFYTINIIMRHLAESEMAGQQFVSSIWFTNPRMTKILTVHNFVGLSSFASGFVAISLCFQNGHYVQTDNLQHLVMLWAVTFHCFIINFSHRIPLPQLNLEYVSFVLMSAVSSLNLLTHLDGINSMNPVTMQAHKLWAGTVLAITLMSVVEAAQRNHLLFPVMRAFLIFLHGTWTIHMSFSLYSPFDFLPNWDTSSNHMKMAMSASFGAHCIIVFILTILISSVAYKRHSRRCKTYMVQSSFKAENEKLIGGDNI